MILVISASTRVAHLVGVHLVPYFLDHGRSPGFAAVLAGLLGALSVTGRIAVTAATARWALPQISAIVFGLQAVGCLVLLVAGETTAGGVTFVVLFGLGFGVGTVARPSLSVEAFGAASFATVSALLGLALTAAKALGPVVAGVLRTRTGDYSVVLLLVAAACLVAGWAVWTAGRVRPAPAATGTADVPDLSVPLPTASTSVNIGVCRTPLLCCPTLATRWPPAPRWPTSR